MNNTIKPQTLKKGDTIAIVSPSSSIQPFSRRTERATKYLQKMGYDVVFMPNALNSDGYSGGTALERADDINKAFLDKNINAILCSTGGITANAVLSHINYDAIRNNPKIFCGFSDITTLLLMITSKTNLVTFHGPTLLPSFGDFEGSISFTFDVFESITSSKESFGQFPFAQVIVENNQYWDKEDDKPLQLKKAGQLQSFGPQKKVSGNIFGGNLQTFVMLMHEEDFFDLNGAILFLEEEGLSTDWYERYILEIERKGIFKIINGLIFAKPSNSYKESGNKNRTFEYILSELASKYNLPIISNVDCGHTKPLLTFPLGINVEIDTETKLITMTDAAVC